MRLHTGGCADTVRESALKADPGRKIPCHTGDLNPRQNCARLFSRTLYQLSYPRQACDVYRQSSGAVRESRWPFCGRKATLNHAYALVTICPKYINPTSEDIKLHIIIIIIFTQPLVTQPDSQNRMYHVNAAPTAAQCTHRVTCGGGVSLILNRRC